MPDGGRTGDAPRVSMRRLSCTSSMYLYYGLTQFSEADPVTTALTKSQPFCPSFFLSSQHHAILSVYDVSYSQIQ